VYQQFIIAACIQDWPRERRLEQILDDSGDATVQTFMKAEVHKWQRRVVHIVCRHRLILTGYKAGNLQSAMSCDYATPMASPTIVVKLLSIPYIIIEKERKRERDIRVRLRCFKGFEEFAKNLPTYDIRDGRDEAERGRQGRVVMPFRYDALKIGLVVVLLFFRVWTYGSEGQVQLTTRCQRRWEWMGDEQQHVDVSASYAALPLVNAHMEIEPQPNSPKPELTLIKMLLRRIYLNKDNCLSQSELKRLIMEVDSKNLPWNVDEETDQLMHDHDKCGDQKVDEQDASHLFLFHRPRPCKSVSPSSVSTDYLNDSRTRPTIDPYPVGAVPIKTLLSSVFTSTIHHSKTVAESYLTHHLIDILTATRFTRMSGSLKGRLNGSRFSTENDDRVDEKMATPKERYDGGKVRRLESRLNRTSRFLKRSTGSWEFGAFGEACDKNDIWYSSIVSKAALCLGFLRELND
ncbi:hypothetical protein M8C21_027516, partial [Ambrosia artemisiifolia]